jgi:hypothetical protein
MRNLTLQKEGKERNSMETSGLPQDVYRQDDRPLSGKSLGKTLAQPLAILWDIPRIASYITVKESMIRCW